MDLEIWQLKEKASFGSLNLCTYFGIMLHDKVLGYFKEITTRG